MADIDVALFNSSNNQILRLLGGPTGWVRLEIGDDKVNGKSNTIVVEADQLRAAVRAFLRDNNDS